MINTKDMIEMSDLEYTSLELILSAAQREKIETLARMRGFDAPESYVRHLISADAEAAGETLTLDDIDSEDDADPAELFRAGWRDVMNGNTHPISTLWDDLDNDHTHHPDSTLSSGLSDTSTTV